ncbi:MAG TPA: hypothetical protein VGN64_05035 [Dyadobacter sp.]|jgi:hypothetical protein|nr:hypothetical protein [Dyadobacter sp.]
MKILVVKDHQISLQITNVSDADITNPAMLMQEFSKQDLRSDGFGLGLWIVSRLCQLIGAGFSIQFKQPYFTARVDF